MDEDGTAGSQMLFDEVADGGELRQQVLRHAVFTSYEEVIAFEDDLLIPGLVPVNPWAPSERNDGGDAVLAEGRGITGTRAIAKIELIGDFRD
jgi:hypothetical protein